ncbi:MAG: hypothetical protein VW981_05200 [Rhodobiaceae bacterium]
MTALKNEYLLPKNHFQSRRSVLDKHRQILTIEAIMKKLVVPVLLSLALAGCGIPFIDIPFVPGI